MLDIRNLTQCHVTGDKSIQTRQDCLSGVGSPDIVKKENRVEFHSLLISGRSEVRGQSAFPISLLRILAQCFGG